MPLPLIRVVKSPPLPGMREGTILTNGNFLYKCKFPLQKDNVYPVLRAFSASAGSQWTLDQNNPNAKEAYFEVA